jgi:hypothetical protein
MMPDRPASRAVFVHLGSDLEMKRLPRRPMNRDTLSITTNTAGTNTSESTVEHNSPPITA